MSETRTARAKAYLLLALLSLGSCVPAFAAGDAAPPAAAASRTVVVYKNDGCGCCDKWAEHLRGAGFAVELHVARDMAPIKSWLGVPDSAASCHTAEIGGYFVEGHVPAEDIERLLHERPEALGIAVPGMPAGSPGMEVPGGQGVAYDVQLVRSAQRREVYSRHGE